MEVQGLQGEHAREASAGLVRGQVLATLERSPSAGLICASKGERLTLEAFQQLSGVLSGYPFVKLVVERASGRVHFIDHAKYAFHSDYIAERIMGVPAAQVEREIDAFNESVYQSAERRYLLAILALHKRGQKESDSDKRFFSLETVEVDTMGEPMLRELFAAVQAHVDPALPLLLKPANHGQEMLIHEIPPAEIPRIFSHELFATASYIPLNPGMATGRLRAFRTESDYRIALPTIEWFDIVVMHRVPDDVPRVAGVINAHHTTPLSHTNVLASGWGIPNAIQLGVFDRIATEKLDGEWVRYTVDMKGDALSLVKTDKPAQTATRPSWSTARVEIEAPEVTNVPITPLEALRMSDRYRYGTKAANLGELHHLLANGSTRMLGYYRAPRPPRAHLLPYLAKHLNLPESAELSRPAWDYLRRTTRIPRGIAIPFSVQSQFLESSPRIQQAIGKLKMALELGAREIDPLCLNLQKMIRDTRMPESIRSAIDEQIASHLSGVSTFVIRSSSNAEDLENFSAAGIYESINRVSTADKVFQGIKEVWSSLISPRSVRLRHDVGISLDDCYMGVIVQEEIRADLGGVLVTTNPTAGRGTDFRNVYMNVSRRSVKLVVEGTGRPYQYLFNTVEGGGRTLSLGDAEEDLADSEHAKLQDLAFAGRLLQSHFSPDYTFSAPVDIEWILSGGELWLLQLRPYAR